MENTTTMNSVLEEKMDAYSKNLDNFTAPQELTVTITLNEYRHLVSAVATAIQAAPANTPDGNTSEGENGQNGPENGETVKGHLDGSDLESMSFADLKSLAQDMGIETGKIRSKAAMIEAITSVEVEASITEEAPSLSVQDVMEE